MQNAHQSAQFMQWLQSGLKGMPTEYQSLLYGARRPGGGVYDTKIGHDAVKGDVLTQGPQTTRVDTNTLRAKYSIAGYDDVKSSEVGDAQSNALFETFSWVPDGYGLGPNNRLHMLNKQHDLIRFGTEEMYQPRMFQYKNLPHGQQPQWRDDRDIKQLSEDFSDILTNSKVQAIARTMVRDNPIMTHDDDEWDMSASTKELPRRQVQPTKPVIRIHPKPLPREQPCSAEYIVPPREKLRATWTSS